MSQHSAPLLVSNGFPSTDALSLRVSAALDVRTQNSPEYNAKEIEEVSTLSRYLFPKNFRIAPESIDTLRVLCSYARCELKPARAIQSHRRFVGPLIVFIKRLSWPLIRFHLKETFDSIQLFHSWAVYEYGKQTFEIEQLKARLAAKEGSALNFQSER